MSKVVRYEFEGSWLLFWALCISGVGIPFAILYLLSGTLQLHTDVDDPELFAKQFREKKSRGK